MNKNHYQQQPPQQHYYLQLKHNLQQLSPEISSAIHQAILLKQQKLFISNHHYIDLKNMILINLISNIQRNIYTQNNIPKNSLIHHLPTQYQFIPQSEQQHSYSPQHQLKHQNQLLNSKLQDLGYTLQQQSQIIKQVHWMHLKLSKLQPLQPSLSDTIERAYQLYSQGLQSALLKVVWQNERYILDLKGQTLQDSKLLEVKVLQRVYVDQIQNPEKLGTTVQQQYQKKQANREGTNTRNNRKYKNHFGVKRGSQKYYIDFEKMIEMSPIHKTSRGIRRIVQE